MDSRSASRDRPPSRAALLRAAPAVGFAAAVLYASVVDPGSGGGGLASHGPLGLVGVDKWLHAGTYAALSFLVASGLSARSVRALALAGLLAVAFGAGVEVVQYPLAARSFDVADALANAVGAVAGVGVWRIGVWLRSRFTRPATPHEQ